MESSRVIPFMALALALSAVPLQSARSEQVPAAAVKPFDADDTKFVMLAAQDGDLEVRLGALAMERGTEPKVKELGAMMAKDHGKANAELKALCTRRSVQLPAVLDVEHQGIIDNLTKIDAPTFDAAYVDEMISAHKNAITVFEE